MNLHKRVCYETDSAGESVVRYLVGTDRQTLIMTPVAAIGSVLDAKFSIAASIAMRALEDNGKHLFEEDEL